MSKSKGILEPLSSDDLDDVAAEKADKQPPKKKQKKSKPDETMRRTPTGRSAVVTVFTPTPTNSASPTAAAAGSSGTGKRSMEKEKPEDRVTSGVRLQSVEETYPSRYRGAVPPVEWSASWSFADLKFSITVLLVAHNDFQKHRGVERVSPLEDFLPSDTISGTRVSGNFNSLYVADRVALCWSMWHKLQSAYMAADSEQQQGATEPPQLSVSTTEETENPTAANHSTPDQTVSEADVVGMDVASSRAIGSANGEVPVDEAASNMATKDAMISIAVASVTLEDRMVRHKRLLQYGKQQRYTTKKLPWSVDAEAAQLLSYNQMTLTEGVEPLVYQSTNDRDVAVADNISKAVMYCDRRVHLFLLNVLPRGANVDNMLNRMYTKMVFVEKECERWTLLINTAEPCLERERLLRNIWEKLEECYHRFSRLECHVTDVLKEQLPVELLQQVKLGEYPLQQIYHRRHLTHDDVLAKVKNVTKIVGWTQDPQSRREKSYDELLTTTVDAAGNQLAIHGYRPSDYNTSVQRHEQAVVAKLQHVVSVCFAEVEQLLDLLPVDDVTTDKLEEVYQITAKLVGYSDNYRLAEATEQQSMDKKGEALRGFWSALKGCYRAYDVLWSKAKAVADGVAFAYPDKLDGGGTTSSDAMSADADPMLAYTAMECVGPSHRPPTQPPAVAAVEDVVEEVPPPTDVPAVADQQQQQQQEQHQQQLETIENLRLEVTQLREELSESEKRRQSDLKMRQKWWAAAELNKAHVRHLEEERRREYEILAATTTSTVSETLSRMMTGEDRNPFVPPPLVPPSDYDENEIANE